MKPTQIRTIALCAMMSLVAALTNSDNVSGQTFLDRQNDNDFRVVSYNMFWDELFENAEGQMELERLIDAVDADVYNFQEAAATSAAQAAA